MLLLIVGMGFLIVILILLMFTVAWVQPESFLLKFNLAKLISFLIEIRLPGTRGRRRHRPSDDERGE
jgi:hypothetical protein